MQLSKGVLEKLREVLRKDIGEKGLVLFTEEDLNDFGSRLLRITAVVLKRKVRLAKEKAEKN